MAITVRRQMRLGGSTFEATATEYRITEKWLIEGDTPADNAQFPALVRAMPGVPQYRDPHPDLASCLAVRRVFSTYSPISSMGVVTYSDNPSNSMSVGGALLGPQVRRDYGEAIEARVYWTGNFDLLDI